MAPNNNNSSGGNNGASGGHKPPDTDDRVLLTIASKQAALVQQLITLTCYIPSSSVGAVIGKRGATIAQIQRQAQQVGTSNGPVRLSIVGHQNEVAIGTGLGEDATTGSIMSPEASPESPLQTQKGMVSATTTPVKSTGTTSSVPYTYSELDWSSPLWTPVVIRADPCAALTAAQLLREKVGRLDDVVMDVPLGRTKHAAVVGRRGISLSNLSADTNVRIMVPLKNLRHDIIQLEGELDNVKQCLERVLVLASDVPGGKKKTNNNNGAAGNGGGGGGGTRQQQQQEKKEEGETETVTVQALPPQAKLRTIGKKTETTIKKKKLDDGSWDLFVSGGSMDNIKSAVAMLKKWDELNAGTGQGQGTPTNSGNNASTPSKPRGRGRQQGRNNNKGKGSNNKQKAAKTVDSPA